MSDNVNSPGPGSGPNTPKSCRGRGRRTAFIVVLVVVAGLTGAAITSAFSHGPGFGPGFGPGHWHGGMMGGSFDPAIYVWDVEREKSIHRLEGHKDYIDAWKEAGLPVTE